MKNVVWMILLLLVSTNLVYAQSSDIQTQPDTSMSIAPPRINTIILVQIYAQDLPLMIRKNLQNIANEFPEIEAVYEVYERESKQLLYYGINLLSQNRERKYIRYRLDGEVSQFKPQ